MEFYSSDEDDYFSPTNQKSECSNRKRSSSLGMEIINTNNEVYGIYDTVNLVSLPKRVRREPRNPGETTALPNASQSTARWSGSNQSVDAKNRNRNSGGQLPVMGKSAEVVNGWTQKEVQSLFFGVVTIS
jgi:hypothetical protein